MKALPEPERAHILVVDDDPAAAAVTAAVLIDLGHSVTVAHSWTEALRLFDPTQTDLVLMDAVMPNVDGLKLTGLLRERSESYVPTVFLTAIRSVDLREQCIDAGADDFLHKPVDPTELRVRLKAMLRIRALTRALEDKSRELERAALTDPLTGVGNRRFFDERLAAEVSRSDRHQRPLSLLMFDIDRFRALNEEHGHLAGDEMLALFGRILRGETRGSDLPCRYGGQEFAIIATETTGRQATALAERIRLVFRAMSITIAPHTVQTVSVGIAGSDCMPSPLQRQDLIGVADEALYRAKELGRDRVEVGGPPPTAAA
ncbi:MAG: diguanylate cyclase [Myxococcales bacterium]|nr:diguanylate cyclase [Myxococcales bacterium]